MTAPPMMKVELEARVYLFGSKRPVKTTFVFDETNVWTGWPQVVSFLTGLLLRGGKKA